MLFATAGQARIFLVTVALGALLGLAHDGVRLLMALFKAKAVRYGLEGLFFCGAALAAFGAVYRCNGGDLQAYTVLGMGVGLVPVSAVALQGAGVDLPAPWPQAWASWRRAGRCAPCSARANGTPPG